MDAIPFEATQFASLRAEPVSDSYVDCGRDFPQGARNRTLWIVTSDLSHSFLSGIWMLRWASFTSIHIRTIYIVLGCI
jgi:hypothetical protein